MERMIQVEKENVEQSVFVEREPITLNIGGTTDYNGLSNKPSINGVVLEDNKSFNELGIQPAGNYALSSELPTKTSDLTNDSGFITEYTETDPTVPGHVKNITQANITSWNNKSDFSGNYNDLSNKPTIPDELSDLSDDSTHRLVTDTEKANWNNKSDFSGSYNDLTNKPTMPTVPTSLSAFTDDLGSSPTHTHSQYLTSHQDISGKEDKSNKVTSISSSSTDTQYPSAKCVYDIVGDIETILTTLTTGNGV